MVWIVQTPDGEVCFVCETKQIALKHFRDRQWRFECDEEGNVAIYHGREKRYTVTHWSVES